jgi:CBS domain-containing membrane protein
MNEIEQIMTANPISVTQHTNINKARMAMSAKRIRHLPVIDIESGKVVGILSQKALLANAIKIINQRGFDKLEHTEKSMGVETIMDTNPSIIQADTSLLDTAKLLQEQRSGCVCIEREGKLVGVVTSSDFVKLVIKERGG